MCLLSRDIEEDVWADLRELTKYNYYCLTQVTHIPEVNFVVADIHSPQQVHKSKALLHQDLHGSASVRPTEVPDLALTGVSAVHVLILEWKQPAIIHVPLTTIMG